MPQNTHWQVEADSEDEAVARAKARAEGEGLEVIRVGRVRALEDHRWNVTLSTQYPEKS